jgi:hypothetical protein
MYPRRFLDEFVAAHRGTRVGRLFGQPAAFAGRRVFARVSRRGLEYRAYATSRPRQRGRRPDPAWILVRPATDRDYVKLAQLLERAIQGVVAAD